MYTKNNVTYSEPNKVLIEPIIIYDEGTETEKDSQGYVFSSKQNISKLSEVNFDIQSVKVKNKLAFFNNGKIAIPTKLFNKKDLKKHLVGLHYDNDDQIDIVLNKDMNDETMLAYNKMQEWYEFADAVADAILTAKGIVEEKTLQSAKDEKLAAIAKYDKSEAVNSFTYQSATMWIDKATRVGMMNAANASKAIGNETITVGISGLSVTMPVDTLIGMLYQLEMYALECYNKTLEHKNNVLALSTIEGVEAYDFTTGYPEKLNF